MWTLWKIAYLLNILGMVVALPSVIKLNGMGFIGFGFNMILFAIFYGMHKEAKEKYCIKQKELNEEEEW